MNKSKNQTAEERLSDIKKLGELNKALTQTKELLTDFPDFISGWLELGLIYRKENNRFGALKAFQKALELSPKSLWANINVATEFRCMGRVEESKKQLKKVLEYYPNDFSILMRLGSLESHRQQKKEALNFFLLASQNATYSSEATRAELNASKILVELGKIDEAETIIKSILKKSPSNIEAKLVSADLFRIKQNFDAAIGLYEEIITLQPKNIQALLKIGDLYRHKQDIKQAFKYHQKALDISPLNIGVNINIAIDFKVLGNLEAAEKQLHKEAFKHCPNDFSRLMQLAQLELTRQKLDLALDYFQKAIDHHPYRIEPYINVIDILGNLGRFDEAKYNLKLLRQKHPEEYRILLCAGKLERKLGRLKKALQLFNLAQEKASNPAQNLEAQILAIEDLRDLGRLDEAIQLINLIIKQFPENIRAQMVKGSILQKKPNLKAAANLYKNVLTTEANHLGSRIELARTYSQLGQIETAISLLEETYQLLGANFQIFILLGSFNQSLENWEMAGQWYQKACQEYPDNPQGYCSLANLMFLQGETDSAIKFLQQAQVTISNFLPILIKLIEFQLRLGNLEVSHQLIKEALDRFPSNVQLLWQLCRLQMEEGNYTAALEALDKISTDNQGWIRQSEQLRGNIYFYQYDYQQAEKHFEQAISLASVATGERNRLATILMLTGRIEEARHQLKIATEELHLKTSPGKTAVPLKSHPAMVTNELRINPPMLAKLQAAQREIGEERILALGSLLMEEPNYLGTALYLARELRAQGIFDNLQQALSLNSTILPTIPKRIVQFWDEPEPPQEVQRIGQSWLDFNPEYQYVRFSLETAVDFLQKHYDHKVLKAFENCDQPATQADFFRLAYLNKMGGFYADADDLCRQSLDNIVNLKPELVVLQEDFACIGNNFLGCIPGQTMIRTAFHQAVHSLGRYNNESPWFKTGPGLITSVVCSSLLPYLTCTDYQIWPRLLVLTQAQLRKIINQHMSLSYKRTAKSWLHNAYQRRIKVMGPN